MFIYKRISALKENQALRSGLSTYNGYITYKPVADSLGLDYVNVEL